ncbi:MAG TPA: ABC transporter ATP-binding protein [Polyangiaceae bacterium]|jgi:putative ABC transport system ATP-binding protein
MSDAAVIALRGVSKDYVGGGGVVHALRDVDLAIAPGEFVAVVGTSGSGKSTLMNILGCLDRPTHGSYELAGIEVGARSNDARAIVRNHLIGFIFQGFNLLPRTTAVENVELPLQYRGIAPGVRRARAEQALAAVGLADRMDHTPNQLSGGQQQRVAIARALVSDPPLLLADEPTGNLDTRTSLEVLALLQRLNRERGITIVLVTHEQDIAACANRVMTFRDGRMVNDVHQEAPLDAAAELAKLPPPEAQGASDGEAAALMHALHAANAPVPWSVYFMMLLGGMVGAVVGLVYNAAILGHATQPALIPGLCSAIGQAWFGAWMFEKRIGQPMSFAQRVKASTRYSLAVWGSIGVVDFIVLSVMHTPLPAKLAHVPRVGVVIGAALFLAMCADTLLRYLLLTAFSRQRRGVRREARA